MSALDKILDPERWNDDSYGDLVTQVSSPTGANTLDAARLELAQLRRAVEALQTINGDLRCNADSRSRGGMTLVETWRIERARAILAEIDGKEPTDGK